MRKLLSAGLVTAVIVTGMPTAAFAAGRPVAPRRQPAPQNGTVQGKAKDAKGVYLPSTRVRVRDAKGGAIVAEVTSDAAGGFSASVPAGSYIVEVVGPNGAVIGLSPTIAVTAGATASVTVTATAVAAAAGTGAAAAGAGFSLFGLGTAASVGVIAGGVLAGLATYVAVNTTSGSR